MECAIGLENSLGSGRAPWHVLTDALRDICRLQLHDRGFAAVLVDVMDSDNRFSSARDSMERSLQLLLTHAVEDGSARPDLTLTDVELLIHANSAIAATNRVDASSLSEQLVAALLNSFRQPAPARD